MKRKTIIISIVVLVIAVIGVYFVFYNSGSGSACPDGTLCQPYGMAY